MPRCKHGGHRQIARGRDRGRVVLEPREPPRAVHPESAQESNLADRGADVRRQPRTRRQHQQHLRWPARAGRTIRTRPRRHRRSRRSPRPARATTPSPSARAATGPYQRSHAARRSAIRRSPMPVTRTSLPGGAVVAMVNRWRASRLACAPRSCAGSLDPGPPRRRQHGRNREHREQHERRVNRRQQRHRHAQPQNPAERGKQRHVHVVEHEHLIAQHGQPIEILRAAPDARSSRPMPAVARRATSSAIVTLSRKRRCTRVLTVRRNHVAAVETPRPIAAPCTRPDRCSRTPLPSSISHSASSASGSAASCDSTNARQHQARLVAVSQLAQPPHRRQGRRQRARSPDRDQERTSYVAPSSSGTLKRCACRSNMVR